MNCRIALFLCICCAAQAMAAVRVALVPAQANKIAAQAIALATAQLSDDKDIQLLDRESIEAVIREQKISLTGLVNEQRVIQLGQLLKTDLFAVVTADAQRGEVLGIEIFDANTGLRLVDSVIVGKGEIAAHAIANAVRAAATKDRNIGSGVRLVSFLPVRNVDLPRDGDLFCQTLRLLLERQLTASSGIAVMERSNLENVNKERALPTSQPTEKLRTSLFMLQLEVRQTGDGKHLRISAILSSVNTGTLQRIEQMCDAGISPADVAEKMRDQIIAALKAQPVGKEAKRVDEGHRFAFDASVLINNGRIPDGAMAAEAAFALSPGIPNRLLLSNALWARASQYLTPGHINLARMESPGSTGFSLTPSADDLDAAVGLATRALALQEQLLWMKTPRDVMGNSYMDFNGGEERLTLMGGFFSRLDGVQSIPVPERPRIAELRAAGKKYLYHYFNGWAKYVYGNSWNLGTYDAEMLFAVYLDAVVSSNFTEFAKVRNDLVHRWIGAFNHTWKQEKNLWMEAGNRQDFFMTAILDMQDVPAGDWSDFSQAALYKSLAPIADDLKSSTCPVMRMYGFIAAARADAQRNSMPQQQNQTFDAFMQQFQATLNRPEANPLRTCDYAYIAAADGIELLPTGSRSRTQEQIELMNIAQRRRHLIPYTALGLFSNDAELDSSADTLKQWLAALQDMLALSQSPDCHVLDGNADGTRQELASEIHDLHQQHPEIGPEQTQHPWNTANKLADLAMLPGISELEETDAVIGDHVCVLGVGAGATGQKFIQGFDIPLSGGTIKPLAKITLEPISDHVMAFEAVRSIPANETLGLSHHLLEGATADAQNFYVSIYGQGIYIFPRNCAPAMRLDTHHGLPTNWTQNLIATDNQLFIASSSDAGTYLIIWNPADHSIKFRISSLRKDKLSLLDNVAGLRLRWMVNDVPRHRLLIGVEQADATYQPFHFDWSWCHAGLWQLDLQTGKLKQLITVNPEVVFGHFLGIDRDMLYISTSLWVIQFNLQRNHGDYMSYKPGSISADDIWGMNVNAKTPRGSGWSEPESAVAGTRHIFNHWLWIGDPFSRISADGKKIELLDNTLTAHAPPLDTVTTIEPAGANQLLLGDGRELYVVTMIEDP